MDEQLIQLAAQSFCKVPEIYQQIFKQEGQDFPDELVQQIKQQPEQAMQMLEQNQDLLKNVVTIYSQYQDQINQVMQQNSLFKEGGKLNHLVNKFQEGGLNIRKRGTVPAYSGVRPEFNRDSTWTKVPNGYIKNSFDGNDLYQNVVTYGINGVPRRTQRIIRNYSVPSQADTSYVDALDDTYKRNPGFLEKLLYGYKTNPGIMDRIDILLKGKDPIQINEKEVKQANK